METSITHSAIHWDKTIDTLNEHKLLGEEPFSIRVEGKPYSVVMRTPGDELAHAAGFCLTEGIVDTLDDIITLAYCENTDTNAVTVTLDESRKGKISDLINRRSFISQTSCGICGKEIVKELYQSIKPLGDDIKIDGNMALDRLETLPRHQPLREKTFASHAAAIYSLDFKLLSVAEDVGRHNALDKAIGKLFLERTIENATLLVLSSRISYELVQKAARARIPVILAMSRPTALAVELASKLNMTLACMAKETGLFIFCGEHRLKR